MTKIATKPKNIEQTRTRLDRVAWALDSVIPLPGGFKLGLDGLVGLIPVIGDGATALLSSYIIGEGIRIGAPKSVILKMLGNLLVDTLLGAIPVVGDLFDIANRANHKNVGLLQEYLDEPQEVVQSSRLWIASIIVGVLALIGGALWASVQLVSWLLSLI